MKYLYPSFTPTVFLFVAGTVAYGVLKYLQNEQIKDKKWFFFFGMAIDNIILYKRLQLKLDAPLTALWFSFHSGVGQSASHEIIECFGQWLELFLLVELYTSSTFGGILLHKRIQVSCKLRVLIVPCFCHMKLPPFSLLLRQQVMNHWYFCAVYTCRTKFYLHDTFWIGYHYLSSLADTGNLNVSFIEFGCW